MCKLRHESETQILQPREHKRFRILTHDSIYIEFKQELQDLVSLITCIMSQDEVNPFEERGSHIVHV